MTASLDVSRKDQRIRVLAALAAGCCRLGLLAATWGLGIWEAGNIIAQMKAGSVPTWLGAVCLTGLTYGSRHDLRHVRGLARVFLRMCKRRAL